MEGAAAPGVERRTASYSPGFRGNCPPARSSRCRWPDFPMAKWAAHGTSSPAPSRRYAARHRHRDEHKEKLGVTQLGQVEMSGRRARSGFRTRHPQLHHVALCLHELQNALNYSPGVEKDTVYFHVGHARPRRQVKRSRRRCCRSSIYTNDEMLSKTRNYWLPDGQASPPDGRHPRPDRRHRSSGAPFTRPRWITSASSAP